MEIILASILDFPASAINALAVFIEETQLYGATVLIFLPAVLTALHHR